MATEISFFLLGIAFLLGIKHSMDADHVVAISGILLRAPSAKKTASLSVYWAMGHMVTASIITFVLFSFKNIVLSPILSNFNIVVAYMLILIAVLTIGWEMDWIKFGKHTHGHVHEDGTVHTHERTEVEGVPAKDLKHGHLQFLSFRGENASITGIGIIHGLASNDELLLLFTLSLAITEFSVLLLGVFIFTLGVVMGMISYSTLLRLPFAKWGQDRVLKVVNLTIATITLVYAGYLLFGGATINLLPFVYHQ